MILNNHLSSAINLKFLPALLRLKFTSDYYSYAQEYIIIILILSVNYLITALKLFDFTDIDSRCAPIFPQESLNCLTTLDIL